MIKGYVGDPNPGFTPTLIGALLFNAQDLRIRRKFTRLNLKHEFLHSNGVFDEIGAPLYLKKGTSKKGYTHRYPRTAATYLRTLKAVEIMRYTYKFSTNNIAFGLEISTRTVKKRLKDLYKRGFKIFHCMRNRLYRSKNPSMMRTLRRISARIQSYIDGQINLLDLYLKLGIDPP